MTTAERAEERIQTDALRGRILEIQMELRKMPQWGIRRALEHERACICAELSKRQEKSDGHGPTQTDTDGEKTA
jgi:hypothetical protein